MLYPDVATKTISQFNGAVTKLDPYTVASTDGLLAQNAAYIRGAVGTRLGHSTVFTQTDGAVPSMFNWFFVFGSAQVSVLAYYTPLTGIRTYNQGQGTITTVMPQTGMAGANMAASGQRLYAAFYDSSGRLSTVGGQVYGWNLGADPLFASPLANAVAASEPGAGVVTAGARRIGFLFTTRNGYTGKLSPVSGGVFAPITFTCSGSKNLQVVITGPFPSYMTGGSVQIVMSTVANLNRYYAVPGATSLAAGNPTITISITDDDLTATGTDVTSYMNLLASSGGTPPFNPTFLVPYSNRIGYGTIDSLGNPVIYFSDPNNYQYITADQHALYFEQQAQPVASFSLRGVCYTGTPHAFYSCEDNGNVPVSWTPPQKVDGSIGIRSPTCVTVNPAQGYAFIASERGLYLFQGGVFPALPLNFYRGAADWNRINWNAPTAVQVVDDQLNKRVIVIAPLDGATTPTHCLTWDYTEANLAAPWDSVKYSLDNTPTYAMASVAIVQNNSNFLNEVWYGPNVAGAIIRQNNGSEANPYRDIATDGVTAAAIAFTYRTALIPGQDDPLMTLHDYHGAHFRVTGTGQMTIQMVSTDGTKTLTPLASPITLGPAPDKEVLVKWFMRQEQAAIQFGTNAMDANCQVALVRAYYTNAFAQR